MTSRALALVLGAVAIPLAFGACSASTQSSGTGGMGAGGASSSTSSSNAGGGITTSSTGGSAGAGGSCVGKASKAQPVPLDIFVMLDQSGSMNLDAGNGMSRWASIKAAITTFVQQPSSAGIGMGLQYFGLPQTLVSGCYVQECTTDADCTGGCGACNVPSGVCTAPYNPDVDSCDPLDYAWAEVPIQPLPGAGNVILTSMGMHAPGTNTPTAPALGGAIDYARKWATKNPTHIVVVALAGDAEPSECETDPTVIDTIAADGFAGTPSIKTFVISVGSALALVNGIASAGGTDSAYEVDLDAMATQHFLDALNQIRGAALGCTYELPPPPMGMMLDFDLVNVAYLPGDNSAKQTFPKVPNEGQCPASGDGWYYDDDAAPTEIILCGATCQKVSADTNAEVDVEVGCNTILY